MRRCVHCILPDNYPGIVFNEKGICNYCLSYKKREYSGDKVLIEEIRSINKINDQNKEYDCLIALSGGRDSSYLLYYFTKVLKLNPIAIFVDNGFIPEQTIINIKKMVNILNVRLIIKKHDYLENCLRHHVLSWINRPSPAMIGMFCTGCRLGMDTEIINFAHKKNINVFIYGTSPFESKGYKQNILKLWPNSKRSYSFILGYLSEIVKNPKWICNYKSFITTIKEYEYHYLNYNRKIKKDGLLKISPFYSYIKWDEKEIVTRIKEELKWERNPNSESTWRGDCDIALLKLYLYRKTLGFDDKDDGLSCLVRDQQITRQEALERIKKEANIPEELIKGIMDRIGVDYLTFKNALNSYKSKQSKISPAIC